VAADLSLDGGLLEPGLLFRAELGTTQATRIALDRVVPGLIVPPPELIEGVLRIAPGWLSARLLVRAHMPRPRPKDAPPRQVLNPVPAPTAPGNRLPRCRPPLPLTSGPCRR